MLNQDTDSMDKALRILTLQHWQGNEDSCQRTSAQPFYILYITKNTWRFRFVSTQCLNLNIKATKIKCLTQFFGVCEILTYNFGI